MKNTNYFMLVVLFVILPSIFYPQGITKEIQLTFNTSEFSIIEGFDKEYSILNFDGANYFLKEDEGEPSLPCMSFNLLVDYGAEFIKLEYSFDTVLFAENIVIQPIIPPVPTSLNHLPMPEILPKAKIYFSNEQFPEKNVEFVSKAQLSQYAYLSFILNPFIYYPEEKKIFLITEINISVTYQTKSTLQNNRWDNGMFASFVRELVVNKDELNDFNTVKTPNTLTSECEYLIITSEALSIYFEPLVIWKARKGMHVEIISLEDIYANYPGETNQLKIKNCVYDYYLNKGLIWVLLGGDNAVVPKQNTYLKAGSYESVDAPCDMFYGCFDNQFDWNADGDEYFGELEDNVDMAPEVIVGRAPIRTGEHAIAFVNKTINYEVNPTVDNFIEKLLMGGVKLWGYVDGISDSELKCELMWSSYINPVWDGNKFRFYDTNTDFGGPSYDVTATHYSDLINTGYHYLYFSGHGGYTGVGMESGVSHNSTYALNLTNLNTQGIFLANSCLTNGFDKAEPCYSEAYIRNPNGGCVAVWTSSRYGWDTGQQYHGPSTLFARYFLVYLFTGIPQSKPYKFGAIASQVKNYYLPSANYYGCFRWLILAQNITGDPDLMLYTYNPQTITVEHPKTIPYNSNYFSISNCNCENGIVTLTTNDTIISKSTITNGGCLLDFAPISNIGKEITLTITGHNFKPYIANVVITDHFTPSPDSLFPLLSYGKSVVGDVDSDGDLDLIVSGKLVKWPYTSKTKMFLNDGTGNFYLVGVDMNPDIMAKDAEFIGVSKGSIALGDYDNDRDIDILITGYNDLKGQVSMVYENINNKYFQLNTNINLLGVDESYCSFIDYDNDGDLDIFIFGRLKKILPDSECITRFYENTSDGKFINRGSLGVQYLYDGDADWGDFDNDGDFDLAITGLNSSKEPFTTIYSYDGQKFYIKKDYSFIQLHNGSIKWVDFNNDGYLDLIHTGLDKNGNKRTYLYGNLGNSNFILAKNKIIQLTNSSIGIGDFDNDGDFDLLLTGLSDQYTTKMYINQNGSFSLSDINFYQITDGIVSVGDFDLDKDLDVFLGGNFGQSKTNGLSTIWSNLCSKKNTKPIPPAELNYKLLNKKVILSWEQGDDSETDKDGLLYDLVLYQREDIAKTSSLDKFYFNISSIKDTSWLFNNLPEGEYYFRIKTIDTGLEMSDFSVEQMFNFITSLKLNLRVYLEGAYR
ncbi:MAG: VCBS repeat-containing protein [Ignavibacteriales bacterium]|nr:VCBS repeat-containing protein [Ignavibacteriales bacterium]